MPTNYGLVPLNEDGSITIKLNAEQMEELTPAAIQDVNIRSIRGTVFVLHMVMGIVLNLLLKLNNYLSLSLLDIKSCN